MELKKAELEVRNFIKRIKARRGKINHIVLSEEQKERRQNLLRLLPSDFNGLEINVQITYKE